MTRILKVILPIPDIGYFDWLSRIVNAENHREYQDALWFLASKTFFYSINEDANRVADALDLRREYRDTNSNKLVFGEASVLEVLVALAERMAYISYSPTEINATEHWFWEMLRNLGIKYHYSTELIARILDRWMGRRFGKNGEGSPFPLLHFCYSSVTNPEKDQRKVEIWYQMQCYIEQNM